MPGLGWGVLGEGGGWLEVDRMNGREGGWIMEMRIRECYWCGFFRCLGEGGLGGLVFIRFVDAVFDCYLCISLRP